MKKLFILLYLLLTSGCVDVPNSGNDIENYWATFRITVKSNQNLQPIEGAYVDITILSDCGTKEDTISLKTGNTGTVNKTTQLSTLYDPHTVNINVYVTGFDSSEIADYMDLENPSIDEIIYLKPK